MFRCFRILWNKLLAVTTPTSVSLTDMREANHGAKNLTMLACFELRIFSSNDCGFSSGTGPADLKKDNAGVVKYKNDRRIAGVKMAMIEQEMQMPTKRMVFDTFHVSSSNAGQFQNLLEDRREGHHDHR